MAISLNQCIEDMKGLSGSTTLKIIKVFENITDVTLHFDNNSYPFKVITDFNKYCLIESPLDSKYINNFNLNMVFKNKNPENIISELLKLNFDGKETTSKNIYYDPFHIFQKLDEYSKYIMDYNKLESDLSSHNNNKHNIITNKIPKELLLSQSQIVQLVINEIKKVNLNKTYEHYIVPDKTNPWILYIRIKYDKNTHIGKILNQLNKDFNYDYIELKLIIDSKAHPYVPPTLEYVKPKIKLLLLLSLMNLDILKLENWNPTITLEYFITNLATQLEKIIPDYIIMNEKTTYTELEYELIKLSSMTNAIKDSDQLINIKIGIPNIKSVEQSATGKYWKSGTGYGGDGAKVWDIKNYIKQQELQKTGLADTLGKINSMINVDNLKELTDSILLSFIINHMKGINMLELENNKRLYFEIFNIMSKFIGNYLSQVFINDICSVIKNIYEELDLLFKSSEESLNDESLLQMFCTMEWYLSKYQEKVQEIITSSDIKEQYCQLMKSQQFGTCIIQNSHRYYKNKSEKLNQKAIMRTLSEISSFKSGLPLNWESSVWVRVPKDSFNLFTFMISGPKDTPYENGLFEFHAYFPNDYPNTIPQVLLHTTGNGKVRFNPNLYDSGKVCLSLLGTWSGQEGETWNPKTSTFLQVMVSIQSLILVEQPYFNEPGHERTMHTPQGKQASDKYNEEREPHTISLAMIDMINNPPNGYEEIVKNHFKMKKEEIINKTLIWQQNATTYKTFIEKNRNELIKLLENL